MRTCAQALKEKARASDAQAFCRYEEVCTPRQTLRAGADSLTAIMTQGSAFSAA